MDGLEAIFGIGATGAACVTSRIREWSVRAILVLGAAIHLAPVTGFAGADALARLYGQRFDDPTTLLLLQHRALLFGLIGAPLLIALKQRSWRLPALIIAITSVVGFLLLYGLSAAQPLAAITRVFWIDAAVLPFLLVAWALETKRASEGAR